MKEKIKDLWFQAEEKTSKFKETHYFTTIVKLFETLMLLLVCVLVFIAIGVTLLYVILSDQIRTKLRKKKEEPQTIAPDHPITYEELDGELLSDDPVERMRKWM